MQQLLVVGKGHKHDKEGHHAIGKRHSPARPLLGSEQSSCTCPARGTSWLQERHIVLSYNCTEGIVFQPWTPAVCCLYGLAVKVRMLHSCASEKSIIKKEHNWWFMVEKKANFEWLFWHTKIRICERKKTQICERHTSCWDEVLIQLG